MNDSLKHGFSLPPEQQAIRDKCFHPSGTFVEFPKEEIAQSIPERFEKIVRMYPDRLAVKDKDRSLTYDELNKNANRIARAILEKRGPDSEPIALLFEHGIDVIAAIFGVLKAGKFYVVLDPSFPQERMAYILENSGTPLIVTNHRNREFARKLASDRLSLLNIDEISGFSFSDNLNLPVSPDFLATILYTSGSTGKPKGVMEPHRFTLNHLKSSTETLRLSINDRVTLLHSLAFATGHFHLLLSLLNGASLFPFDVKSSGVHTLAKWLEEEQISLCRLPPSLFRQLAESLSGQENLESLRLILLSGAPITQVDFDLYKKNFGAETQLNFVMGSSEAGIICSAVVDRTFCFPKEGTPLGYPTPGKQVLLLDENGVEVGPGQVGEIVVKSRNSKLGYWNQPDLTGTNFLPDPSGGDERVYWTGDLGRMLPDGFLIHLGRKDVMVKIRGYRVEIAEIERVLLAHPKVKDVGVVAWDHEPGEKYLVAYVVPLGDAAPTINELNNFLKENLPDYMMPSAFMFLQSLPLTNGKLDRTALPRPDHKRPNLEQPYAPPHGDVEVRLVQLWEEILNVRPIGMHDNFFDLGGHSLAASRVISRVIQAFQLELPVKALFDAPTVAEMAAIITQNQAKRASDAELAQMLREVEAMTEEEAQKQLAGKSARSLSGERHE
jgi:amino acid adenylation domain-containing protein